MKYKKIAEKLIELIDSGLFNDVWFYIKDFTNYKLLFVLQDYPDNVEPPSIEVIDNQSNFLIGTIDQEGFIDYLGFKHPIVLNDYYKENIPEFIAPFDKYYSVLYNYHNFNVNSIFEIPASMKLKIDEVVWLLLLKQKEFESKIHSMQLLLNEHHKSPDASAYFDYSFYLVGACNVNKKQYYDAIVLVDCDVIEPGIVFTGKNFEENLLEKAKSMMEVKILLVDKLRAMPQGIESNLTRLERKFFSEDFSAQQIQEYHKIVETYAFEIHKLLLPKLINIKDKMTLAENEDWISNYADKIKRHKVNFRLLSIKDIVTYLKFIKLINDKFSKTILGVRTNKIIDDNLEKLAQFSDFSKIRNLVAHSFENINENIGKGSIYVLRWVIEFLDELYYELKVGG